MAFTNPHSQSAIESATRQARSKPVLLITILSIIGLVLGISLLIVTRRLLGAISEELPRDTMLMTAVVTAAVLASCRIAWRRSFPLQIDHEEQLFDQIIGWGSSLALILLAVGCCYPAYHNSDWMIWLPLLIADQFWRQSFFDAGYPTVNSTFEDLEEEPQLDLVRPNAKKPIFYHEQEDIVQQLFRVREDNGQEVIYGTLRADFQPEQRTAVVHVGFCPPLDYVPEIEAESLPGQTTRIKVVQAFSHGVRLDIRLPAPAKESCHVWIDMAARPNSAEPAGLIA